MSVNRGRAPQSDLQLGEERGYPNQACSQGRGTPVRPAAGGGDTPMSCPGTPPSSPLPSGRRTVLLLHYHLSVTKYNQCDYLQWLNNCVYRRVIPDYVFEFESWLMSHGQVMVIFCIPDVCCCILDVFFLYWTFFVTYQTFFSLKPCCDQVP